MPFNTFSSFPPLPLQGLIASHWTQVMIRDLADIFTSVNPRTPPVPSRGPPEDRAEEQGPTNCGQKVRGKDVFSYLKATTLCRFLPYHDSFRIIFMIHWAVTGRMSPVLLTQLPPLAWYRTLELGCLPGTIFFGLPASYSKERGNDERLKSCRKAWWC